MNKIITIMAFMIFTGNLFAQTGTIELKILNINPEKGKEIMIAVSDKTGFLKKPIYQKKIMSKGKEVMVILKDIKIGKYTIGVYQDENSDGEMNKNFFGKPKELSGFSNDAKGFMGPPDFNDAAFDVIENQITKLVIHLK